MSGDTVDPARVADELREFETNLARLEEVVETLERGGATLQRSLELFEEGMTLLARLQGVLHLAESRIEELVRNADGTLGTQPLDAAR